MPYACSPSPSPRPATNPGKGTCRRPAPAVVRRVLHRIVGEPSQRPTAVSPPCLHPTSGLRRLPAPILHGGPQIPREMSGQRHPPRPRRPSSLPHPLGPPLSRSRLLVGLKSMAESPRVFLAAAGIQSPWYYPTTCQRAGMFSGITVVPVGERGSSYGVLGSRCDTKTGDNEKASTGRPAAIGIKPRATYSDRKSRADGPQCGRISDANESRGDNYHPQQPMKMRKP